MKFIVYDIEWSVIESENSNINFLDPCEFFVGVTDMDDDVTNPSISPEVLVLMTDTVSLEEVMSPVHLV